MWRWLARLSGETTANTKTKIVISFSYPHTNSNRLEKLHYCLCFHFKTSYTPLWALKRSSETAFWNCCYEPPHTAMDDSAAVSQGYSTLLQFGSQLFLYGYDDTALTKTTKKYCSVLNRYTLHTRYRILCGQVIRSKLRLRQLSCEYD